MKREGDKIWGMKYPTTKKKKKNLKGIEFKMLKGIIILRNYYRYHRLDYFRVLEQNRIDEGDSRRHQKCCYLLENFNGQVEHFICDIFAKIGWAYDCQYSYDRRVLRKYFSLFKFNPEFQVFFINFSISLGKSGYI